MITIVDYGVGNIASLVNMYDYLGHTVDVSDQPDRIRAADKLILPGVGAFDKAMSTLQARNLVAPIRDAVLDRGRPLLGVCLGMQLLARGSEEGNLPGLALIDADVVHIPAHEQLKVPHMGWAEVESGAANSLFPVTKERERFYFVHSYFMRCDDEADCAGTVDYGTRMCVAVSHRNVHGVQFHPEKSHRFGMRLLNSFADM
jgi:glutamine amidotransferase